MMNELEEKFNYSLVTVEIDKLAKCREEMSTLVDKIGLSAKYIRNGIKELNKIPISNTGKKAQEKIIQSVQYTLTLKLKNFILEYAEVQKNLKKRTEAKLYDEYSIYFPNSSVLEFNEAIETGNINFLEDAIRQREREKQAKDAYWFIVNKSQDICRMKEFILELHELFMDAALMVEMQGEILEKIEYNVDESIANVVQSTENLKESNKKQKKARKKMCILIGILSAILGISSGGIAAGIKFA